MKSAAITHSTAVACAVSRIHNPAQFRSNYAKLLVSRCLGLACRLHFVNGAALDLAGSTHEAAPFGFPQGKLPEGDCP